MDWLESALAFALTMVVFSTMVSAIMEVVHRALGMREAGFKLLIEKLFDDVLWPLVRRRLAGTPVGEVRDAVVGALTRNSVAPPEAAGRLRWLGGKVVPRATASMSVMEFMERLAGTEIGQAIAQEGDQRVKAIINDLAQKFDRYGEAVRQRFFAISRALAVVVSILLAFSLNIDAMRLMDSFLANPGLRRAMIDQQDKIEQSMRRTQDSLRAVQDDLRDGALSDGAKANLDKIEKTLGEVAAARGDLKGMGVPIGGDYFPFCAAKEKSQALDPRCEHAAKQVPPGWWHAAEVHLAYWWQAADGAAWSVLISWGLSVLLGGLLIGLGAPFWFDVATGLSRGLKLLKSLGYGAEKEEKAAAPAYPDGATPPPRTPVEAFVTAIQAAPMTATAPVTVPAAARALLAPNGDIVTGR